jgi:uncharacterized membrane protein
MPQHRRIQFIDSARGTAMLFVLLSHFGFTFFPDQSARLPTMMRYVGMVASPSFILINGILIGFLQRVRSVDDYNRLKTLLIDRGLFLLTIGHLLLMGSHAPAYTLRFFSITDTIAACILVTPFLAERLSPLNRIGVGLAAYFVSVVIVESWQPHPGIGAFVKETFAGSLNPVVYAYSFPILPWFAVNCIGSALGAVLGRYELGGQRRRMRRLLAGSAILTMTAALLLSGAYVSLKHEGIRGSSLSILRPLADPLQKTPPGPDYLLWYGGLGLMIILVCATLQSSGRFQTLLRRAAQLGEASFFVFVLQFYVYLVMILPFNRRLLMPSLWPIYLLVTCTGIIAAAFEWQRRGWNRFLTVGYRHLRERHDADCAVANAPQFDSRHSLAAEKIR